MIAENIDLFYSLITEGGINLQGAARRHLDTSIEHTCSGINEIRARFYTTTVRDMWKQADSYWNE